MRVLFQGDSVTESCRATNNDENIGNGYPALVKAKLGFESPGKYEFINRGISGNRVTDIYARIKKDIINLKPDVMSILVGVNDVWLEFLNGEPDGVDAEKYYKVYDMLIDEVKTALPDIKIIIMGSFVIKGPKTIDNWEFFDTEVIKRSKMAKKIAEKYNLPFVELQEGFDELSKVNIENYWTIDGVHPTIMGHEHIKNEWLKAFKSLQNEGEL